MSATKALVTGSTGFVGRHLVAHLTAMGDHVTGIDRAIDGLDITDAAAVGAAIADIAPNVIYHLAGWADVGGSWKAPVEAFRANAEGTLNVLSAATDCGVERVVAVSSGTIQETLAAPGDVFREAVRDGATAVIVAHNHPSGNPEPSQSDLRLTTQLAQAGEILGISLLDHVVFGDMRFVSLKERQLM